jgi:hypothetical protein
MATIIKRTKVNPKKCFLFSFRFFSLDKSFLI